MRTQKNERGNARLQKTCFFFKQEKYMEERKMIRKEDFSTDDI